MKSCNLSIINTTCGPRYLIVTCCSSKEFKTLKGAERWAKRNGYQIARRDVWKERKNIMNNDKIKSLIKTFKNINIYDIETALLIYEYIDNDINEMTEKEINEIYKFVKSMDNIMDDYVVEKIRNFNK